MCMCSLQINEYCWLCTHMYTMLCTVKTVDFVNNLSYTNVLCRRPERVYEQPIITFNVFNLLTCNQCFSIYILSNVIQYNIHDCACFNER